MQKQKVIAVVGPTASGKTALGVFLAEKLNGEVISCDSMQIYKGMDIATAKPTAEEMRGIRHHLIDFIGPNDKYSVARFCTDAENAVEEVLSKAKLPIFVGGTGLYIDSFLSNTRFFEDACDGSVREKLNRELSEKGVEPLYARLCEIDPAAASKIHKNNALKIIRALEVYETSGKTITMQTELSHADESRYDPLYIGIGFNDRQKLYERIELRADLMIKNGLIDEAERFYASENSDTSVNVIGYKELKPYLDGEAPLETCVDNLKRATRHYAKRQLTWFRRNENINWFFADDYTDTAAFFNAVLSLAVSFTGGENNE